MQEDTGTGQPQTLPVVLDTNVVLDWHLFKDRRAARLVAQLESGALRWHATASMLAELEAIWPRSFATNLDPLRRKPPLADVLCWVTVCAEPPFTALHGLRCSDRSDQKFIDLALGLPALWLVTRDRAVLKLAARARRVGVLIGTPETWADATAS
jgi:predicted nucleic acid-binding protein